MGRLNAFKVLKMRQESPLPLPSGAINALAREHEVTHGCIQDALHYRSWDWVIPFRVRVTALLYQITGTTEATVRALNAFLPFKEQGLVWTAAILINQLKSLGIYRYIGQSRERQWKTGRMSPKAALKPANPGEWGHPRKEIPYGLLKQAMDDHITHGEIVERCAYVGLLRSRSTVCKRLYDAKLHRPRSETIKWEVERGIRPSFPPKSRLGGPRKDKKRAQRATEAMWIIESHPSPLGQCQLGDSEATFRFRLDFGTTPISKGATADELHELIAFLCPRHAYLIKKRQTELGLPPTLETGKHLLGLDYPSSCKKKAASKICPGCGIEHFGRGKYHDKPCAQKAYWLRLYEARVLRLYDELHSARAVQREFLNWWPSYYQWKNPSLRPLSRDAIRKVIQKHCDNLDMWKGMKGIEPTFPQETRLKALKMHVEGKSVPQISKEIHVSVPTISIWLKNSDIARGRSAAAKIANRAKYRRLFESRVMELYDEMGGNLRATADLFLVRWPYYKNSRVRYPTSRSGLRKIILKHKREEACEEQQNMLVLVENSLVEVDQ